MSLMSARGEPRRAALRLSVPAGLAIAMAMLLLGAPCRS